MATTAGHLALMISAQIEGLRKDLARAEGMVDKSAKQMKDSIDRTSWGDFFRGAFLLSQFKKFIGVVRLGADALKASGQAGAEAAAEGLRKYDEAMSRIAATIAVKAAPAIGEAAEGFSNTIDHLEQLGDWFQGSKLGRALGLKEGMDRRNAEAQAAADAARNERERANIEKIRNDALLKKMAERNALEQHYRTIIADSQSAADKYADTVIKLKKDFGEGIFKNLGGEDALNKLLKKAGDDLQRAMGLEVKQGPFEKFQSEVDKIYRLIEVPGKKPLFDQLYSQAFEQLLQDLDLVLENKDPFANWRKSMEDLNRVMFSGDEGRKRRAALEAMITDRLKEQIGLAKAANPVGDFRQLLDNANRIGGLTEDNLALIGQQFQGLLGDRSDVAKALPRLMERGSAEALGAIQAFRSLPAEEERKDPAKQLVELEKEAQKKREEQVRIGKRLLEEAKKKPRVVGK